jgi:hypothetical protein
VPRKAVLKRCAGVFGAARLRDLRPLLHDGPQGFAARPHDGHMTWLVVAMIAIGGDDQLAVIRRKLGLLAVRQQTPALTCACTLQPVVLGVGQQDLAMFRRP